MIETEKRPSATPTSRTVKTSKARTPTSPKSPKSPSSKRKARKKKQEKKEKSPAETPPAKKKTYATPWKQEKKKKKKKPPPPPPDRDDDHSVVSDFEIEDDFGEELGTKGTKKVVRVNMVRFKRGIKEDVRRELNTETQELEKAKEAFEAERFSKLSEIEALEKQTKERQVEVDTIIRQRKVELKKRNRASLLLQEQERLIITKDDVENDGENNKEEAAEEDNQAGEEDDDDVTDIDIGMAGKGGKPIAFGPNTLEVDLKKLTKGANKEEKDLMLKLHREAEEELSNIQTGAEERMLKIKEETTLQLKHARKLAIRKGKDADQITEALRVQYRKAEAKMRALKDDRARAKADIQERIAALEEKRKKQQDFLRERQKTLLDKAAKARGETSKIIEIEQEKQRTIEARERKKIREISRRARNLIKEKREEEEVDKGREKLKSEFLELEKKRIYSLALSAREEGPAWDDAAVLCHPDKSIFLQSAWGRDFREFYSNSKGSDASFEFWLSVESIRDWWFGKGKGAPEKHIRLAMAIKDIWANYFSPNRKKNKEGSRITVTTTPDIVEDLKDTAPDYTVEFFADAQVYAFEKQIMESFTRFYNVATRKTVQSKDKATAERELELTEQELESTSLQEDFDGGFVDQKHEETDGGKTGKEEEKDFDEQKEFVKIAHLKALLVKAESVASSIDPVLKYHKMHKILISKREKLRRLEQEMKTRAARESEFVGILTLCKSPTAFDFMCLARVGQEEFENFLFLENRLPILSILRHVSARLARLSYDSAKDVQTDDFEEGENKRIDAISMRWTPKLLQIAEHGIGEALNPYALTRLTFEQREAGVEEKKVTDFNLEDLRILASNVHQTVREHLWPKYLASPSCTFFQQNGYSEPYFPPRLTNVQFWRSLRIFIRERMPRLMPTLDLWNCVQNLVMQSHLSQAEGSNGSLLGKEDEMYIPEVHLNTLLKFNRLPRSETIVAAVRACVEKGHIERASGWLRRLESAEGVAEHATVALRNEVMRAYAEPGHVWRCERALRDMEEQDLTPDQHTFNAVLKAYVTAAEREFESQQSLRIYGLKEPRPAPDAETFMWVIKACVGEKDPLSAERWLEIMEDSTGLTITEEHYSIVISAWAETGIIEAAERVLNHCKRSFEKKDVPLAVGAFLPVYLLQPKREKAREIIDAMLTELSQICKDLETTDFKLENYPEMQDSKTVVCSFTRPELHAKTGECMRSFIAAIRGKYAPTKEDLKDPFFISKRQIQRNKERAGAGHGDDARNPDDSPSSGYDFEKEELKARARRNTVREIERLLSEVEKKPVLRHSNAGFGWLHRFEEEEMLPTEKAVHDLLKAASPRGDFETVQKLLELSMSDKHDIKVVGRKEDLMHLCGAYVQTSFSHAKTIKDDLSRASIELAPSEIEEAIFHAETQNQAEAAVGLLGLMFHSKYTLKMEHFDSASNAFGGFEAVRGFIDGCDKAFWLTKEAEFKKHREITTNWIDEIQFLLESCPLQEEDGYEYCPMTLGARKCNQRDKVKNGVCLECGLASIEFGHSVALADSEGNTEVDKKFLQDVSQAASGSTGVAAGNRNEAEGDEDEDNDDEGKMGIVGIKVPEGRRAAILLNLHKNDKPKQPVPPEALGMAYLTAISCSPSSTSAFSFLGEAQGLGLDLGIQGYVAALTACESNKERDETVKLLRRIQKANLELNADMFVSVFKTFGGIGHAEECIRLLQFARINMNEFTVNGIIEAYGRLGGQLKITQFVRHLKQTMPNYHATRDNYYYALKAQMKTEQKTLLKRAASSIDAQPLPVDEDNEEVDEKEQFFVEIKESAVESSRSLFQAAEQIDWIIGQRQLEKSRFFLAAEAVERLASGRKPTGEETKELTELLKPKPSFNAKAEKGALLSGRDLDPFLAKKVDGILGLADGKHSEKNNDSATGGTQNEQVTGGAEKAVVFADDDLSDEEDEGNPIEILEMMQETEVPVDHGIFEVVVDAYGGFDNCFEIFKDMKEAKVFTHAPMFEVIIDHFAGNGDIKTARTWMKRMLLSGHDPHRETFFGLVDEAAINVKHDLSEKFMRSIAYSKISLDEESLTKTIQDMLASGPAGLGQAEHFLKGMEDTKLPVKIYDIIIEAHTKAEKGHYAQDWLDVKFQMKYEPSREQWRAVVYGCFVARIKGKRTLRALDRMRAQQVTPDMQYFNKACERLVSQGDLRKAEMWLQELIGLQQEPHSDWYNAIVRGHCDARNPEEALVWMFKMEKLSLTPYKRRWRDLFSSCKIIMDTKIAARVLRIAHERKFDPDPGFVPVELIQEAKYDDAITWLDGMKAEGFPQGADVYRNMFRSLRDIEFCKKLYKKFMAEGLKPSSKLLYAVLESSGGHRRIDTYFSVISPFRHEYTPEAWVGLFKECKHSGDAKSAVDFMAKAREMNVSLSRSSYVDGLAACAKAGESNFAQKIAKEAETLENICLDTEMCNLLVRAHAKCANKASNESESPAARASRLLERLLDLWSPPNSVSVNGAEACVLRMQNASVPPDRTSFGYMLRIYSCAGEAKKAGIVAELMHKENGAQKEDFNELVRACARAGDSKAAFALVETMKGRSITPNAETYHYLLEAMGADLDAEISGDDIVAVMRKGEESDGCGEEVHLGAMRGLAMRAEAKTAARMFEILLDMAMPRVKVTENIEIGLAAMRAAALNASVKNAEHIMHLMRDEGIIDLQDLDVGCSEKIRHLRAVGLAVFFEACARARNKEAAMQLLRALEKKNGSLDYKLSPMHFDYIARACSACGDYENSHKYAEMAAESVRKGSYDILKQREARNLSSAGSKISKSDRAIVTANKTFELCQLRDAYTHLYTRKRCGLTKAEAKDFERLVTNGNKSGSFSSDLQKIEGLRLFVNTYLGMDHLGQYLKAHKLGDLIEVLKPSFLYKLPLEPPPDPNPDYSWIDEGYRGEEKISPDLKKKVATAINALIASSSKREVRNRVCEWAEEHVWDDFWRSAYAEKLRKSCSGGDRESLEAKTKEELKMYDLRRLENARKARQSIIDGRKDKINAKIKIIEDRIEEEREKKRKEEEERKRKIQAEIEEKKRKERIRKQKEEARKKAEAEAKEEARLLEIAMEEKKRQDFLKKIETEKAEVQRIKDQIEFEKEQFAHVRAAAELQVEEFKDFGPVAPLSEEDQQRNDKRFLLDFVLECKDNSEYCPITLGAPVCRDKVLWRKLTGRLYIYSKRCLFVKELALDGKTALRVQTILRAASGIILCSIELSPFAQVVGGICMGCLTKVFGGKTLSQKIMEEQEEKAAERRKAAARYAKLHEHLHHLEERNFVCKGNVLLRRWFTNAFISAVKEANAKEEKEKEEGEKEEKEEGERQESDEKGGDRKEDGEGEKKEEKEVARDDAPEEIKA
eukprot:jgi/Bigna1/80807/fgenesh1_pg.74_\